MTRSSVTRGRGHWSGHELRVGSNEQSHPALLRYFVRRNTCKIPDWENSGGGGGANPPRCPGVSVTAWAAPYAGMTSSDRPLPRDILAEGWDLYRASPRVDAVFDVAQPEESARRIVPLVVEGCPPDGLVVEEVLGGITNTLYKCTLPSHAGFGGACSQGRSPRAVLVRIFGDNGVDREKETALFASYAPLTRWCS